MSTIFKEFVKKHPYSTIFNFSFALLTPFNDILLPHLYGLIIDKMYKKKPFVRLVVLIISLLTIVQLGYLISDYCDIKLFTKLDSFMRTKLFTLVLEGYETDYCELQSGKLIANISKVPDAISGLYEKTKFSILPNLLIFVFAIVYFFLWDPIYGIILTIIIIIVCIIFFRGISTNCKKITLNFEQSINNINENFDDSLRNLTAVFVSNAKDFEIARTVPLENVFKGLYKKLMICIMQSEILITPMEILVLAAFFIRSLQLLKSKNLKTSQFVAGFIILLYVMGSISVLGYQLKEIIHQLGVIQQNDLIVEELQSLALQKRATNQPILLRNAHAITISFKNVTFGYSKSRPILNNLTLDIKHGENVILVGDIGSGKSTFVRLLLEFKKPQSGTIYFNDIPAQEYSVHDIRDAIGYVPQQPILFNRSVMENLRYGNNKSEADILTILEKYKLLDEFTGLEDGLNTIAGKNGSVLSGGQRQIVWCVRIILRDPKIIILDEPTASLDEKSKNIIYRMLTDIMKDRTIIMVTHDEYLMKRADREINFIQPLPSAIPRE